MAIQLVDYSVGCASGIHTAYSIYDHSLIGCKVATYVDFIAVVGGQHYTQDKIIIAIRPRIETAIIGAVAVDPSDTIPVITAI